MNQSSIAAFHVLWTKPSARSGKAFSMNNAEMLTLIVSVLMWQKHNGTIKLYTDKIGYAFIKEYDLVNLWDGIDTETLENNDYPIDSEVFWAAGKLIALEAHATPCVMLDTDLIVLRPISHLLNSNSIVALHAESLHPDTYLNPSFLKLQVGFKFPAYYNWEALPSNTAFLYIDDDSFKTFYLNESKRFMFHNEEKPEELVSQMVFAEQRLLSICASYKEIPITHLLTDPFTLSNDTVIHLWGFKNLLRQSKSVQTIYCRQLIKTVSNDLATNSFFQHYLEKQLPWE